MRLKYYELHQTPNESQKAKCTFCGCPHDLRPHHHGKTEKMRLRTRVWAQAPKPSSFAKKNLEILLKIFYLNSKILPSVATLTRFGATCVSYRFLICISDLKFLLSEQRKYTYTCSVNESSSQNNWGGVVNKKGH